MKHKKILDTKKKSLREKSEDKGDETETEWTEGEKQIPIIPYKSSRIRNKIRENCFHQLSSRQIRNIPTHLKLTINDIKRICKYVDGNIFDGEKCCLWKGYITNMHNSNKGTYINFYFRKKKTALHRLLYSNFVKPLGSDEYLKFHCQNKGICCNVNHYKKYRYLNNTKKYQNPPKKKERQIDCFKIYIMGPDDEKLVLDFE